MVTTVTTTTVTTVTTVTMLGLGFVLGLIAVVCLIALLTTKELVGAGEGPKRSFLTRFLDVGIVPLIIVFAVIVITEVVGILV